VLRYLVRVTIDTAIDDERRLEYNELEIMINEMFPNSLIQIFPLADKVIVRGQARDTEEAVQISSVLRAQGMGGGGAGFGGAGGAGASIVQGPVTTPFPGRSRIPQSNLVNLIRVPGEQQIMLKVRIAQLNRTAVRNLGIDWSVAGSNFMVSSMFGNGGSLTALLDNNDVQLIVQATSSNTYTKVLAEPNLITLNGQTATFISGGQFAIPTAVGIGGIGAAGTSFQGYGTQLLFTPTIMDKDRIRLQIVPTYSQIDKTNAVNGIPGLTTRSASTTVDMREGQWLAIAGLLEDDQSGSSVRFAGLGSIPVLGVFFRNNSVNRQETELLILISPELVHPLEAEQLPLLLPGMDVTEPNEFAFYWKGQIEGDEGCNFRSTVVYTHWVKVREAIHEAKREARYLQCEQYYVIGPHGFSE
jgi:pilus assembly protein CpaC